jgi:hypothetical protein
MSQNVTAIGVVGSRSRVVARIALQLLPLLHLPLRLKTKTKTKTRVRAVPAPVHKRPSAIKMPTTTANTQFFDSSWSATAVFSLWRAPRQCVLTRATRHTSSPSSNLQFHHHLLRRLLPARHPNPNPSRSRNNCRSNGTCSWETAQSLRAARGPSGSRARSTRAEKDDEREGKGNRRGKRTRFFVGRAVAATFCVAKSKSGHVIVTLGSLQGEICLPSSIALNH